MKFLLTLLFPVGAVLALSGAAVHITGWPYSPYVYTVGALLVVIARIAAPVTVHSPALRRLRGQQVIASLLLLAAGVLMFLTRGNDWIVCLTIAAVFELYTAFRIPQEEKKAREKE